MAYEWMALLVSDERFPFVWAVVDESRELKELNEKRSLYDELARLSALGWRFGPALTLGGLTFMFLQREVESE